MGQAFLMGQHGGGAKLNVFAQPDEPATKDGLWVATPEKHSVGQITTKDSFIQGGTIRSTYDITNLDPSQVAFGYLVDDHYLYYINKEYSSDTGVALYLYRYDFITHTNTAKRIYDWYDTTNHIFNKIRYSFFYKVNGLIKFIICSDHNGNWGGAIGSFDPATFDALDHIDTQNENNIYEYLVSYPIIAKNNDYCILREYTGSYPTYYLNLRKFDNLTCTTSLIVTVNSSSTSYYAFGGIYDNILYYHAGFESTSISISDLSLYDLINKTVSTIHLPFTLSIASNSPKHYMLGFQNKLIIPFVNPFVVLDLATLTEQTYNKNIGWNCPGLIYQSMFLFYTQYEAYKYTILDFVSETLDPNQLAVLNGRDYSYKIISTAKMNYLRAVLNNVWWYDTDFREYPTYIGNGTSWTKIKN